MKKAFLLAVLTAMMPYIAEAGTTVWHDPLAEAPAGSTFIHNQAWNEDGGNYSRLPMRAKDKVRKPLWDLSRNSSGLALRFTTDAKNISVKYTVDGPFNMPHMPSTGVSGIDLYRDSDKAFCFGGYSFADTVRYNYTIDRESLTPDSYTIYLPLYNTVTHLEIGVPEGSSFNFIAPSNEKPVVAYGTSITQGACASRPAMAWTNIVERKLGMPLMNIGFSGNGKLEPALIDLIGEIDASVYVIDCMQNLGNITADSLDRLIYNAVTRLRSIRPETPILLVDHSGYSNGESNAGQYATYTRCNNVQRDVFRRLQSEGVKDLYYLTREELGFDPDGWVDYVHPSDYGMASQARAVTAKLHDILSSDR